MAEDCLILVNEPSVGKENQLRLCEGLLFDTECIPTKANSFGLLASLNDVEPEELKLDVDSSSNLHSPISLSFKRFPNGNHIHRLSRGGIPWCPSLFRSAVIVIPLLLNRLQHPILQLKRFRSYVT